MSKITLAVAGALALAAIASTASAQTRPAAPAASAPATGALPLGPAIPGFCVIGRDEAIAGSLVGKAIAARLKQLDDQASAELQADAAAFETDRKQFETVRPTLDQAALQTRQQELQSRIDAIRQKQDLRNREMRATQEKALGRVYQEMIPVLTQLYGQHKCSVLLERQALLGSNPEMDITGEAVTGLNAKITTMTFDREHLDMPAPAAAH